MRRLPAVFLAAAVLQAFAQQPARPKLEPLPGPPPPAPGASNPIQEPQVRIPVQEGDKVEPIRAGGLVVMLKVTPKNGHVYYLIDTTGNGGWMRRDSLDDGVRVPMWPIKTWK
jgi:Protein of unknown function (DUF2782)